MAGSPERAVKPLASGADHGPAMPENGGQMPLAPIGPKTKREPEPYDPPQWRSRKRYT